MLVVIEQRDFIQGCLRYWLDAFCQEFEVVVVSDIELAPHADMLRRAVAVLIGTSGPLNADAWLERQIACLRAKRDDLPAVVIAEASYLPDAKPAAERLNLHGYIPTSSSMELAAAALRLVVAGGSYFPRVPDEGRAPPPPVIKKMAAPDLPAASIRLTPRERAVLDLLGRGTPNKIIAFELKMSLGTVKVHVHNIIRKLNVPNRTAAAVAVRAMQAVPAAPLGPILATETAVVPILRRTGDAINLRRRFDEERDALGRARLPSARPLP